MRKRAQAKLGDILQLSDRALLAKDLDDRAIQVARGKLREAFAELCRQWGLCLLEFGIKLPSRTRACRVIVDPLPQVNGIRVPLNVVPLRKLHPRSKPFRAMAAIANRNGIWLMWVYVLDEEAK